MNRRAFSAFCCCSAAGWLARSAAAQAPWQPPARFTRPEMATDEGGLWALMDREETRLRRSPFALKDAALNDYVRGVTCRLAGDHCPDVRVYLVRTPLFNASMAPNGMMQVWTGLMLRMENEAQLAAVLGHEIGHFLQRHGVERLRDVKSRLAFAQVLGVFGLVGAIGQIGVIASAYAYTRDQEREADSIGFELMRRSGYDVSQASRVWENLLAEIKARPDYDPVRSGPMLATHPAPDERRETLQKLAQANPGGAAGETEYASAMSAFQREWLREEVKRGQHEESIALLSRMAQLWPTRADLLWARGEVHRLRAANKDIDAALADFNAAIQLGNEPPETHRGLAYIYRARSQRPEALSEFQRYIELAPDAIDGNLIKNYIAELSL